MKQYQHFLQELKDHGKEQSFECNKILAIDSYLLEYLFEKEHTKRICSKTKTDGFPIISQYPKLMIEEVIKSISSMKVSDFEKFNRTINSFCGGKHTYGSFKHGKILEFPFLKKPQDFRIPSCKISEPPIEDQKRHGYLTLEMTCNNYNVITELPKILDYVTLIFCILCHISGFRLDTIRFTLKNCFCTLEQIKDVDLLLAHTTTFKEMKIRSGLKSFFTVNRRDISFSM